MGSDLIALIVAAGLGVVVVVLGLRRDLSETTRNNLPRFEDAPEQVAAAETVGWSVGEQVRKPLSPRQARWLASFYLLIGIGNAAFAVLSSSSDGLVRLAFSALFVLAAVLLWLGKWPYSVGAQT